MFDSNFPKDLPSFEKRFGNEEECRKYLFKLKWPNGFICPSCGCIKFWWTRKHKLHCSACGHQSSVTVGTVMENSKKPLTLWFKAIFLVSFPKSGISAKNLQRLLGLGSYQTAWTWLHKIRRSMVKTDRNQLGNSEHSVEVDEAYVGGKKSGKRGRGASGKIPIVVAVETKEVKGIGRIRIQVIKDCSSSQLLPFLQKNIINGSTVRTDDWSSYTGVDDLGFNHSVVKKVVEILPSVHLVISLFKRWLLGVHQGYVSQKHLQYYADEFVFRFNRRTSKERALVFHRLLEQVVQTKTQTYDKIVCKKAA